jgi:hypothetical protein
MAVRNVKAYLNIIINKYCQQRQLGLTAHMERFSESHSTTRRKYEERQQLKRAEYSLGEQVSSECAIHDMVLELWAVSKSDAEIRFLYYIVLEYRAAKVVKEKNSEEHRKDVEEQEAQSTFLIQTKFRI